MSSLICRQMDQQSKTPSSWLALADQLFELETSARKASNNWGSLIPRRTRPFTSSGSRSSPTPETVIRCWTGRLKRKKPILKTDVRTTARKSLEPYFLFSVILERKGLVKVEPLQDVGAEAVFNLRVRAVRKGSIVYTDRWGRYDALMFCDYKHSSDYERRFSREDVHMSGTDGSWVMLRKRWWSFTESQRGNSLFI